jgi:hypothetical protein
MHGMTGWDNARKYETAYCAWTTVQLL